MIKIKIYDGSGTQKIWNACYKYYVDDIVYIVEKGRFGRMKVIKDRISSISHNKIDFHYRALHSGFCFSDNALNVFDNEEDAMQYAERQLRRRKIKFIDETEV